MLSETFFISLKMGKKSIDRHLDKEYNPRIFLVWKYWNALDSADRQAPFSFVRGLAFLQWEKGLGSNFLKEC